MKVAVIFDEDFSGSVDGVVWIVDTPSNRRWFAAQIDRAPASAIFSMNHASNIDAAIVDIIGDAQEHSPDWTTIEVVGAALSERIELDLTGAGHICDTEAGFQLHRR